MVGYDQRFQTRPGGGGEKRREEREHNTVGNTQYICETKSLRNTALQEDIQTGFSTDLRLELNDNIT